MDDIANRIEHTVLGPATTWADVSDVLDAALGYGMRACVPPCYLDRADEYAPTVDLTTVVGFPHGQATGTAKALEAEDAWERGAAEIDVVANRGFLIAGETERLSEELNSVVAAVPVPVKVIVEAPMLDDEDLHLIGELVADAGAAYLKTATGFADGGATVDDVELLSEYLPVKASGGVGSWSFTERLFDAGAERIGTSSGDVVFEEYRSAQDA